MSGLCIIFGGLAIGEMPPGSDAGESDPIADCELGALYFAVPCQSAHIVFMGM